MIKLDALIAQLQAVRDQLGHGEWPVFAAEDDEGNGFHSVDEVEPRNYGTWDHDEYGWEDDLPEQPVIILW